jgi:SAM-dependent methyltransferase
MNEPKVDFDDYTESYNRLLREGTGFFSETEAYFAKYKVDILRREAPGTAKRLLEYGCGIGRNIPFLRAALPKAAVFGSDISAASLEIARKENPGVDFLLEPPGADFEMLFDIIFIAGVFHHIPLGERAAVMKTIFRRLSPGGTILVFEHNPFNPVTRKIVNNCPYDRDAVLLKPSELKTLLADAGLLVRKSAYCLFVPPSLAFLLPLEARIGWLPMGGQYWVKASRSA